MAFIDTYRFQASAGRGGDGVVRWRREKFVPKGGPAGGDGGRGGDFYIRAVRDVARLGKLYKISSHHAMDGEAGGSSSCKGKNGDEYVLELPLGSIVVRESTGATVELLTEGEKVRILAGGEGGYGNEHFKSSTNQAPTQCTQGKQGESDVLTVELRLIADVGLVGLPNAGKTSLLNALTNAGAKVADYPFTTLDPNLGIYFGYVLADIPGLIEGASEGKGLGHQFLRHITRTRAIIHCISLERDIQIEEYGIVRHELESHGALIEKKEYIIFTKSDMVTPEELAKRVALFETLTGLSVFATVSVLDDESLKKLGSLLTQELAAKSA
ncbi:MAG: GTPase ObgE [Candidatus Pacebacteria bacterium]|nr:GTPase ObgE [Candidatus Paceibacterota bacterium]